MYSLDIFSHLHVPLLRWTFPLPQKAHLYSFSVRSCYSDNLVLTSSTINLLCLFSNLVWVDWWQCALPCVWLLLPSIIMFFAVHPSCWFYQLILFVLLIAVVWFYTHAHTYSHFSGVYIEEWIFGSSGWCLILLETIEQFPKVVVLVSIPVWF